MRSVFLMLAVRKDAGFSNPYYLLEARERSLALIPLPRRWMGTWMLLFVIWPGTFLISLFLATELVAQFYPTVQFPWGLISIPLILVSIPSYGWSQRLAWRLSKTNEKSLRPEIKNIKRGILSSTLTVETEDGKMSLVVQARKRIINQALELAGASLAG